MADADNKWYYDPKTGDVEQGKVDSWANRMGPYDTHAEALNALRIAEARTAAADDAEEDDDDWGEPASWEK